MISRRTNDQTRTALEVKAVPVAQGLYFAGYQADSVESYTPGSDWITPYQNNRHSVFGFFNFDDAGVANFICAFEREHTLYSWTGNPTVLKMRSGTLVAISMSADAPFMGRGVIEMTFSIDNGMSWAPWQVVYSSDVGSPDKPSVVEAESGSLIIAFVDFSVTSDQLFQIEGKAHQGFKLKGELKLVEVIFSEDHNLVVASPISPVPTDFYASGPGNVFGHYTVELYQTDGRIWGILAGASKDDVLVQLELCRGGLWEHTQLCPAGIDWPICRVSGHGQQRSVLCYRAHRLSQVLHLMSTDSGETWSQPSVVAQSGNVAASAFSETGELAMAWSELDLNGDLAIQALRSLHSTNDYTKCLHRFQQQKLQNPFFGAYQDLIWNPETKKFDLFCVAAGGVSAPLPMVVSF